MQQKLTRFDRLRLWIYDTFGPGELNLYLVRHGQSEGNVDPDAYKKIPDHAIDLTDEGVRQADMAGEFLADHLFARYKENPRKFKHVRFFYSSYVRSRHTTHQLLQKVGRQFAGDLSRVSYREDSFLFEQQAGRYSGMNAKTFAERYPEEAAHYDLIKKFGGKFYAPVDLGESQVTTALRVQTVCRSIIDNYRNRKRGLRSTGAIPNVVVSTHGVTMNMSVMEWMNYLPEWAACELTPKNCAIRHIHGSQFTGYIDEGYIYGEGAPLRDPKATQLPLESPRSIFVMKPQRPGIIVPQGNVSIHDPFEGLHK